VRFIPTKLHGFVDYVFGSLLLGLPFWMEWQDPMRWLSPLLGVSVFAYSLLTDYELGVVRFFHMRFHLLLDVATSAVLIGLPLVLPGGLPTYWPLLALGVLGLALSLTTEVGACRRPAPPSAVGQ